MFWLALALVQSAAQAQTVYNHMEYHLPIGQLGGYSDTVILTGPIYAGNEIPDGVYIIKNSSGDDIGCPFEVKNGPAPAGTVLMQMHGGNSCWAAGYPSLPSTPTNQYPLGNVPWGVPFTADYNGWTLNRYALYGFEPVVGEADGGTTVSGECMIGGSVRDIQYSTFYVVTYDLGTDRAPHPRPPRPSSPLMTSAEQAAPAQHRKVALNGRPLPDGKPQTAPESDAASEESFVDAFTLSLRHDTTDIYVPVASTDLALQVRRSTAPEVWCQREGLQPSEMPDRPFGSGWTSNLAANIHFVRQTPQVAALNVDADYAYVTDEDGSTSRFLITKNVKGVETYVPLPGARNQQDAYLNTLAGDGQGGWVFRRKFGTTLAYADAGIKRVVAGDRINPPSSYSQETHTYARLSSVTDRTGASLNYAYTSAGTLIPQQITVQQCPSLSLTIETDAQGKVRTVTDPRHHTWNYTYQAQSDPTACTTLAAVAAPPVGSVSVQTVYGYSLAVIDDTLPGYPSTPHLHCDVASIQDPRGKIHKITYQADQSCQVEMGLLGFYPQPGLPRVVSRVDLPDGIGYAAFGNHSFIAAVPDPSNSGGLTFYGHKANYVVDAATNGTLYQFTGPSLSLLNSFKPYQPNRNILDPLRVPHIVLFQGETVTSFNGQSVTFDERDPNNLSYRCGAGTIEMGRESYTFDLLAGMAPSSATDMSGNTTWFTYDDIWNFTANYASLPDTNYTFGRYADPTTQKDAKGVTKYFTYFPAPAPGAFDPRARRLIKIVDEERRTTLYGLDEDGSGVYGNRTSEKILDPGGNLIQWTSFDYRDPIFHGFMTSRTVNAAGGGR